MVFRAGSGTRGIWIYLIILMIPSYTEAVQYSITSNVDTRLEYNDNIFLTSGEHDSVFGLVVTPSARMIAKEANWETYLNARLRSNNYSDHGVDGNDIYLDASGNYKKERDIFTLSASYDKDSNLNPQSSDFGLTAQRVNRRIWSITPQYTRLLTQRLYFSASYSHTDVEYENAANTGYVPYDLDTLSGSFAYNLTERDKLSFILQASNYNSKDNALEYQLYIPRFGVEHQISELWKADFSIGGSRRNSTSRITQTFDFFGQPITQTQEIDFSNKGYVFDAGIEKKHETGSISARASRNNVANSYGGLNNEDTLQLSFKDSITELWRYTVNTRYQNIQAVSGVQRSTNREIFLFQPVLYYIIDRNWTANASYRYIQQKFTNDVSNSAPHSNQIYIGITYHFPEISTF